MMSIPRRQFLTSLTSTTAGLFLSQCSATPSSPIEPVPAPPTPYRGRLPLSTVFVGREKFDALCHQAQNGSWASLPLGERTTTVGKALLGTRYGNYTLEIDDHIESPSVNLTELDCWTFYETSLAFSRMIHSRPAPWNEADLLHFIELERYRGGCCDTTYLSRMHHLEEVFADSERRGLGRNMTRSLGGVPVRREITEMQHAWHSYRYLRNNPELRTGIAKVEQRVSNLPVTYLPKSTVAGLESSLQSGDVLAIVARDESGYTSHVGLALRDGSNCRFMHATSSRDKGRRCIIDMRISQYLADKSGDIGLIVFRPYEAAA